jgi:hypothetical protein
MGRNRLGCFTFSGILSAIITILVIAGVAYARGGLMYNPGPLNAEVGETLGGVASHAGTDGDCEACHSAPWSSTTMADLCVNCHGEIAQQMQSMVALHGSMYQSNPQLECRNCHPEHKGAQAPLTVMQGGEFPHELLGYSLNGHRLTVQGEAFTCADCHHDDISAFASDTCDACHRQMDTVFAQAHLLSFGAECLDCHDGVDRFGDRFNHNISEFRLTGGHREVECVLCHVDARGLADFETASRECYACHHADDPHQLRFGTACDACHTIDGWEEVTFDHNLSAFKLEGQHARVGCEACHQNNVFQGAPTDCFSCHRQDDEHNGRFGTDCGVCHTPFDWDEATFDHNRSNFPLTGAHVDVFCEECHTSGQFTGLSIQCVACHEDPIFHVGVLGTECQECHNTSVWTPAQFNLSHPEPRVDEEGTGINHGRTTCRTCHPSTVREYTCLECHTDNQGGEGEEHEDDDDD